MPRAEFYALFVSVNVRLTLREQYVLQSRLMFHKYESFTCPKVMVGYTRSCRTFCDQHDEILNRIIVTNSKLQLYLLGNISQITMFVVKTIFPYKQQSMKKKSFSLKVLDQCHFITCIFTSINVLFS